jgi:RNA polymerase sigma-70 factor, ECF subfamily
VALTASCIQWRYRVVEVRKFDGDQHARTRAGWAATGESVRNTLPESFLGMALTASNPDSSTAVESCGFDTLYEQNVRSVWAYAVSRVGRQAAEDVTSETFAIAWRRRTAIPADPLPWLLGVARHLVVESFRTETRQRVLDAELRQRIDRFRAVEPDVAEFVTSREQALRAFASLSDSDREILMLLAWHGLSARRAAQVVACSRPAFFVRLHRARRRLERALEHGATDVLPADRPTASKEPYR